jgi:pyruvate/2-oxoglutarate dehydrogenase complex dihydrolipoamide dehydrogenase (E3) component
MLSMLQLGEFSSVKSGNSRNTSYRNKGTYSKEQSSILSQGHKKINSFNNFSDRMHSQADARTSLGSFQKNQNKSNIILENFKRSRDDKRKVSKTKRSKDTYDSDYILAKGSRYRLIKP